MKVLLVFTLILVAAASASLLECSGNVSPPSTSDIPIEVINLDLPPRQRWARLMTEKAELVKKMIQDIKNIFGPKIIEAVDEVLPSLTDTLPSPYKQEIEGIAEASGIELGEITLYNIFYEVFSFCTSIVAEGEGRKLYHVRNMDFGLLMGWDWENHTWPVTEHLRPLTVEMHFEKKGKTVFKSVGFAGYVGLLTAMKPGEFSLTVDERFQLNGGYVGIIEWILGMRNQQWLGFLTRDVLENSPDYADALFQLSNARLLSPAYFILGGNKHGQGAVITRGHKDVDVWRIGQKSEFQNGTFYVIETNYDHWEKPPSFDNRRDPAIHCLDKLIDRRVTRKKLYQILSTKPMLNRLTVYSTIMEVKEGRMDSYLRTCPRPCPIW